MSWIVTAYYTADNFNSLYKDHAAKLAQSMIAHGIRYEITPISDLGSWQANTQYKPTFLKQMLQKHRQHSIVYVDVDAVFLRYPALFDEMDRMPNINISVHVLDHSKYRRKGVPPEMLSGTIFMKNNAETMKIVDEWVDRCASQSGIWDQAALSQVLHQHPYYLLPDRYCCIFDYMAEVKDKVIVHNQASRAARMAVRAPVTVHH